ncbi:MAG: L-serine ammonia-lyase [Pseudomonadota bacterium]
MAVSVFDLFKVGIGPSSSHTVGPMRAAKLFVDYLRQAGLLDRTARLSCALHGSLGATGKGHGSDTAVMLGLMGEAPDTVDVDSVPQRIAELRAQHRLALAVGPVVDFDPARDIVFYALQPLPLHANGMRFTAFDAHGAELAQRVYYSVGGGFVVSEQLAADGSRQQAIAPDTTVLPLPFHSGAELLVLARQHGSIAAVMRINERHWRTDADIDAGLLAIWRVMQACVARGCATGGELPGWLRVRRRAADWYQRLGGTLSISATGVQLPPGAQSDPLQLLDWVNLFALAVNEENAAGGRVVTAPTNGAAGIIPAALHYYTRFVPQADDAGVIDFLLTAGAIGLLYKKNASISGAEVGCQGEVGVACSMAAAGLCAVLGGTPEQVENAAEIGMEHHLGLTCDPVGGLVQVPCIERNAIASVQALNAARMALNGDGRHIVSLDQVIKTMRDTGADMQTKYKETARGGLAVNIVEC